MNLTPCACVCVLLRTARELRRNTIRSTPTLKCLAIWFWTTKGLLIRVWNQQQVSMTSVHPNYDVWNTSSTNTPQECTKSPPFPLPFLILAQQTDCKRRAVVFLDLLQPILYRGEYPPYLRKYNPPLLWSPSSLFYFIPFPLFYDKQETSQMKRIYF